ncbi:CBS domain-containing protein [Micromonospora yasonensis]|uniref:CBS domain-containing protein n=1 Tax=Micromonospora yasonensis TaxID=1128667 RepID=UPI00222F2CEC|nr:CBS domain-containing protein [Micromonospora yasonensis]MCW3841571.1 CBS domain-containing protein [Micromonospora yasonensis]
MRTWRVDDVMTRDVATVREETPYRQIVDVLIRRGISAVPVVDSFDRVLGVVSEADLLHKVERSGHPDERRVFKGRRRRTAREKAGALVAGDLMTAPAVTTTPPASLPAAARLMDREAVKRLPVLDDLGRLVGIVTRSDLLRVHLRTDAEIREDVVQQVLRKVLAVRDGLVTVQVCDGEVTLDGRLDRRSAVDLAGRLAAQVAGVVQVHITVGYDVDDTSLMELDPVHAMPIA